MKTLAFRASQLKLTFIIKANQPECATIILHMPDCVLVVLSLVPVAKLKQTGKLMLPNHRSLVSFRAVSQTYVVFSASIKCKSTLGCVSWFYCLKNQHIKLQKYTSSQLFIEWSLSWRAGLDQTRTLTQMPTTVGQTKKRGWLSALGIPSHMSTWPAAAINTFYYISDPSRRTR